MSAKVRLTKIITQAVGLVGMPANMRSFISIKNEAGVAGEAAGADQGAGGETPVAPVVDAPPDANAPKPLTMPSAVKAELSQGLASALDTLAKIAEAVNGAQVDEASQMPVELLMQLDATADTLDDLADKYTFADGPSAMGEATLTAPGEDGVTKTVKAAEPPPAPGAKRKMRLLAKKRMSILDEAHKAIGEAHAMMGGGIEKMSSLMKELSGETSDTGTGKPEVEPPKAVDKPDAPVGDPNDKPNDGGVEKALKSAVSDALAPLMERLVATEKALGDRVAKIEGVTAPPNRALVEGDGGPPAAEKQLTYRQQLDAQKKALGK